MEGQDMQRERERQAAFLAKHQGLYDQVIKTLIGAIVEGDTAELALHLAYLSRVIEYGLNIHVQLEREGQGQGLKWISVN